MRIFVRQKKNQNGEIIFVKSQIEKKKELCEKLMSPVKRKFGVENKIKIIGSKVKQSFFARNK